MSITTTDFDNWKTKIGNFYGGLYYYVLKPDFEEDDNGSILGFVNTIQSAVFCPFFNTDYFSIYKIPFDTNYFGKPSNNPVNVYRITGTQNFIVNNLYSDNLFFKNPKKQLRNWENESKLQMSPYTYYLLCDFYNQPLEIEPQYLPNNGTLDLKVMYTISNRGGYNLYIDGYKGDYKGNVHGIINQSSLDIPVLSSAYSQFLATSKNSFNQNLQNTIDTNNLSKAHNKTNFELSLMDNLASNWKNIIGAFTSGVKSGANYEMTNQQLELNKQQAISSALAQVKDLETSPRAVASVGNDALFSMNNSKYGIDLIKFGLSGDGYERLGTYFALYGYKQNKFMSVNYRNRYYYNYIKTLDCNLKGNIPKEYLQKIKQIFNNGVTVWHVDREGVKMYEYIYDNYEV